MASAGLVLIVDDEPQIRRMLRVTLASQGFATEEAADAATAIWLIGIRRFDAVVLDLGLPDRNGLEVIREVRRHSAVPILVLSARSDEAGKVEALDLGADDYVTKPFGTEELLARIRTALRHRLQERGTASRLHCGPLAIDLVARAVERDGIALRLTNTEFEILKVLAENAGRIVTHDQIVTAVWRKHGPDAIQYLRVYIRALRQKLGQDDGRKLIETETGVGYRLVCTP